MLYCAAEQRIKLIYALEIVRKRTYFSARFVRELGHAQKKPVRVTSK